MLGGSRSRNSVSRAQAGIQLIPYDQLTQIPEFLLSGLFVTGWCGTIVVVTGVQLSRLWSGHASLRRAFVDLKQRLIDIGGSQNFGNEFEKYNDRVRQVIGQPWAEFVETLITPEPGSGGPIRNSADASQYLNEGNIIFPRISFRKFESIPNILTGVGILGTFVGLAAGVHLASSGLVSGEPAQINNSLQQLMAGASLAFITSITGIACSIFFLITLRLKARSLRLALGEWVQALEDRLQRVTAEAIALDQLEHARRTSAQMERFNTDLVFAIEKALEEKVAGRLAPQLDRLVDAVQGLREDRSTDAGQMIQHALDRFTEAMQGRTSSQFDEMASIVGDLNQTLVNSAAAMEQSRNEMRGVLDSVAAGMQNSMNACMNSMTETLNKSLESVAQVIAGASQRLADNMTSSSNAAAEELRETFGSVSQGLARAGADATNQISGSLESLNSATASLDRSTRRSEDVLSGMTTFVERLNALGDTIRAAQRSIELAADPLARSAQQILASSGRSVAAMEQTKAIAERIEGLVSTLDQQQQSVTQMWAAYQERFEGVDESLARVFRQISDSLLGYQDQVRDFMTELDRTTGRTAENLASATSELTQSIEDLIPRLPSFSQ